MIYLVKNVFVRNEVFYMEYEKLAASVMIAEKGRIPKLKSYDPALQLIGTGRSAYVFKVQNEQVALKVTSLIKHISQRRKLPFIKNFLLAAIILLYMM